MKRVMIIGQPGSGKSTLARMLGERTGLPVRHIDLIHWKSGWVERSRNEKHAMAHEVHMQDRWIFEGNMSATYPERIARADTCIWLDIPLWLRLWRVAKRTVAHYGQVRPDLPDGCPEQFSAEFYHFIWTTRKTGRLQGLKIVSDPPPHLAVHHLQSVQEVRRFLASIPAASSIQPA
ncbi:DNA topology modulation protein FlaR [Actibacterium sp. 188UL27-1]|uniref:DNA topology modulation protein FlaR n=1 Tax=Actibacterium sp. 188UL27-1 TaxID=2786961 RepID=UPI00195957F5|nr:DNA topology modulation protein FlaR [Actibacterium sp. 188UL27-1]MBM7067304.1 DNA topology modulation protein FlaR [Actibacterium sp. 188UL27-1]